MFDVVDGDLHQMLAAKQLGKTKWAPEIQSKTVLIQSLAGKDMHLLVQKKAKYAGKDILEVWCNDIFLATAAGTSKASQNLCTFSSGVLSICRLMM